VPEPAGGAHRNPDLAALNLKKGILKALEPLARLSPAALEKDRQNRFRAMGRFQEKALSR